MKFAGSLGALTVVAGAASAFPGMDKVMAKIEQLDKRDTPPLLGDLETLDDSELTPTGKDIKAILLGNAFGQNTTSTYDNVPEKDSDECAQDKCCIWKYIADDMRQLMVGNASSCNSIARGAIRLGFHDAASWSKPTGPRGGADGSILLAGECEARVENKGLEPICNQTWQWFEEYKEYGISMADLIQMGATVGAVVCPLGPRVRSFVGRKDSSEPAPEGNLPSPFDSADALIAMFEDKTISPQGLVALVGAHTTSQQEFVDMNRAGDPQDSTPGIWDTNFYGETASPDAPERVFKFQSDISLSQDPRTSPTWQLFTGTEGQIPWDFAYAQEYVRMSMLGVYNINDLTECTKVLPEFIATFTNPDEQQLQQFASGTPGQASQASADLQDGNKITS